MGRPRCHVEQITAPASPGYQWLPLMVLAKAPWNYKDEDAALSAKLKANIQRNGQVENLVVRQIADQEFEVINGNHRLDIFAQLQIDPIYVYNLGEITLEQAKQVAIELNETRFDPDTIRLARIVTDLAKTSDGANITQTTAFDPEDIKRLNDLIDFSWQNFDGDPTQPDQKIALELTPLQFAVWEKWRAIKGISNHQDAFELFLRSL